MANRITSNKRPGRLLNSRILGGAFIRGGRLKEGAFIEKSEK